MRTVVRVVVFGGLAAFVVWVYLRGAAKQSSSTAPLSTPVSTPTPTTGALPPG